MHCVFLSVVAAVLGLDVFPFQFNASMVTAFDGGPFVVRVELAYRGDKPIRVIDNNPTIEGPASWSRRFVLGAGVISASADPTEQVRILSPGDRLVRYASAADWYSRTPSGSAKVVIQWPIVSDRGGSVVAAMRQIITVNVEKSEPAAIKRLRSWLCNELSNGHNLPKSADMVWAHLKHWHHSELLPLFVSLLNCFNAEERQWQVLSEIHELPLGESEVATTLVAYLATPHPRAFAAVIADLASPPRHIPNEVLAKSLKNAPNVWVRALAITKFPELFTSRQATSVAQEIRAQIDPVPSSEFLSLVKEFDSPYFRERESAAKRMTALGEGIEGMIRRALLEERSAEAQARLKNVLQQIETIDSSPEWLLAVKALERSDSPQAEEFLRVIAGASKDLRSTQEARRVLDQKSKKRRPCLN